MRRRVTKEQEDELTNRDGSSDDSRARTKRRLKDVEIATSRLSTFRSSIGALLLLLLVHLPIVYMARKSMYQGFVVPLPANVSYDKISEGRAMNHVYRLAKDIGVRQEGSKGLAQAAKYLKAELEALKSRASTNVKLDVEELLVNGSFNMVFLLHSIGLAYRDHIDLILRISAKDADDAAAAVLVNGHFDGPLGSPGAADCATCVASMLEVARYIVDTDWVPPAPIIFLFNGAEEVFLAGAHGFVKNYKSWTSIGAVINVEASGASGPDIVVQSGPGAWPSRVYAKSAVFPMANSAAQDIFPLIPGDTDYRIFSQDHGDVPGLDIIFVLDGYVYHTGYDKPENIVPGSLQARGENLFALLKGFTSAPELMGSAERALTKGIWGADSRPVFFDVYGLFMVYYPQNVAIVVHMLPLMIVLGVIMFSSIEDLPTVSERFKYFWQGLFLQVSGLVLGVLLPVVLAVARLSTSSTAMTWFAQPWIALLMFVPIAVGGLLIPRVAWATGSRTSNIGRDALDWSNHWGAVGLNSILAAIFTLLGFGSGFFPFWWAAFMIPGLSIFKSFQHLFGEHSMVSMLGYIIPAVAPTCYSVYFGGVLVQFIAEKMGMSGTFPQPYGFYVADIILSIIIGTTVGMAVGPIIPIIGNWIAKPHALRLLVYISIGSAAFSAGMFPYSMQSPKRVIFQQTIQTEGNEIVDCSYDFATVDPNPMSFVFKHSPEVCKRLQLDLPLPKDTVHFADPLRWTALYPMSSLFSRGPRIAAAATTLSSQVKSFPQIHVVGVDSIDDNGGRRVHMVLDLGALTEVWASVLNVTGPLSSWSFSDGQLPGPEYSPGSPPYYVCRLTGGDGSWPFWMESNTTDTLHIELRVLDQKLYSEAETLVGLFPAWAAVVAATGYLSSYVV